MSKIAKLKYLVKRIIISLLPGFIISEIENRFMDKYGSNLYYSQEGEDIILERFFGNQSKGFFIDVGAHHPITYSNTYKLYLKGWRGINIDATPGSMKEFNKIRPEDLNVEIGITEKEGELNYYLFKAAALNTFSNERVEFLKNNSPFISTGTVKVKTKPLYKLLSEKLLANQKIDFMSVDVEGLDYAVLLSNDWKKFRPGFVLIEQLDSSVDMVQKSNSFQLLKENGYELIAKTHNTVFYKDSHTSERVS